MFFGLLLITVGAVFLLENLGIVSGNVWNLVWPLIVILFGVSVLVKPALRSSSYKEKKSKKN